MRSALEVSVGGRALFTSVEATWNVLEPSAGPVLAEAAAAGVTVIVKEALANGRLAPSGADPAPGVAAARVTAARLGVGVDQVALAACLAQPWAWRVLSGAVTVDQLRQNLAANGAARGGRRACAGRPRRGARGLLGRPLGPQLDMTSDGRYPSLLLGVSGTPPGLRS